ncbi:dd591fc4-6e8e-4388-9ae2-4c3d2b827568, partial [Thermothielavioides terrestris]
VIMRCDSYALVLSGGSLEDDGVFSRHPSLTPHLCLWGEIRRSGASLPQGEPRFGPCLPIGQWNWRTEFDEFCGVHEMPLATILPAPKLAPTCGYSFPDPRSPGRPETEDRERFTFLPEEAAFSFIMTSKSHVQDESPQVRVVIQHDHLNPSILEAFDPFVHFDERVRLPDTDINSLDGIAQAQNPLDARPIPAQPLIARLHGRVEHRVPRQDLGNVEVVDAISVGDLDEAAVLSMRRARIAWSIPWQLLRVARRQNFVFVGVHKHRADAELGGRRRRQPCLLDGIPHVRLVIAWRDGGWVGRHLRCGGSRMDGARACMNF